MQHQHLNMLNMWKQELNGVDVGYFERRTVGHLLPAGSHPRRNIGVFLPNRRRNVHSVRSDKDIPASLQTLRRIFNLQYLKIILQHFTKVEFWNQHFTLRNFILL